MHVTDTAEVAYYQQIHNIVKASSANKQLIFNPGQPMVPEAYLNTSDVFVTFEGSAESYTSFEPATYTNSYPPSRFYHIVYGADTSTTINSTLQQFSEQHAKWLYMTDLLEPNPYYDLPGNATWAALLDYMSSFTTQSVA